MGCASSSAAQTTSIQIPGLPGKPVSVQKSVMFAAVDVQMKAGLGQVKANLGLVQQTVTSAQFAGAGWRVKGCYMPTQKSGDRRGQPIEMQQTGLMSGTTRANLFFSGDGVALETCFYETAITLQAGFLSVEVQSMAPLYQALQRASNDGYTVSCILDNPDTRLSGLLSATTTVTLVCQRPVGVPPKPRSTQFAVVGVPVNIKAGLGSLDADTPTLAATLDQYGQQGYRLCAAYDPPVASQSGLLTATSYIILIFEQVGMAHSFCVVDGQCVARAKFMEVNVDHEGYRSIIQGFTNNGWSLDAAIDLPKCYQSGMLSATTTLRLIFSAPSSWRAGSAVQPSVQPSQPVVQSGIQQGTPPQNQKATLALDPTEMSLAEPTL